MCQESQRRVREHDRASVFLLTWWTGSDCCSQSSRVPNQARPACGGWWPCLRRSRGECGVCNGQRPATDMALWQWRERVDRNQTDGAQSAQEERVTDTWPPAAEYSSCATGRSQISIVVFRSYRSWLTVSCPHVRPQSVSPSPASSRPCPHSATPSTLQQTQSQCSRSPTQ